MRFPFKVAVRFLKSNKGQTALIALGIAVGVSVQIFIGSLIQGLQKSLVNKTIGNSPQITVTSTNDNKVIEYYNDVLSTVKASDDRIINLSLSIDKPALIKKEDKTYSVLVRGMNLQDSDKIYNIKKRIYEGKEPLNDFETLVGKELKDELNASLGDEIKVITNSGDTKTLKISGFYDLKVANLNKTWLITTLKTSETLYALSGKVTSIEMQVTELFKADDIALNVSDRLDGNLKVDNWKAQNAELLSGLNGQSVSRLWLYCSLCSYSLSFINFSFINSSS